MLRARGHYVHHYVAKNQEINGLQALTSSARGIWSFGDYSKIRSILRNEGIDIVHVHNYQPLISPSIFHAAQREGIPAVITLHNYRQICPGGQLLREGQICEDCLGKAFFYPGVVHGCYRGSRAATAAVAASLGLHRWLGTWDRTVSAYIVLTEFARRAFIRGGLPASKLYYRPNFVTDNGIGTGNGGYFLFVGRLSPEKGLPVLLDAWKKMDNCLPLKIVGEGPLQAITESLASKTRGVHFLGPKTRREVYELMAGAIAIVVPSEWYEGAPSVIMEAFAKGTPAIVSRLGGMESMVDHGRTGLFFDPGDSSALAAAIGELLGQPGLLAQMRRYARAEYEDKYTEDVSYDMLIWLYKTLKRGLPIAGYRKKLDPAGTHRHISE